MDLFPGLTVQVFYSPEDVLISMSRARDQEKILVPDRIGTYDLLGLTVYFLLFLTSCKRPPDLYLRRM